MIKHLARRSISKLVALCAPHISRSQGYISAAETVAAAAQENISVCDYVEKLWSQRGNTQRVIDHLESSGMFGATTPNILEIGAGTGRYLEKVIGKVSPARYESYETATDWARWLASTYPIISHKADGISLHQTPSNSIDLLHAHGVFVYLPFLVSYGYWKEIWRVVRCGGWVAFDCYSENCFDQETVEHWLESEHRYPCIIPRDYVTKAFALHGFVLHETFCNPYGMGRSEYLIFRREPTRCRGN